MGERYIQNRESKRELQNHGDGGEDRQNVGGKEG